LSALPDGHSQVLAGLAACRGDGALRDAVVLLAEFFDDVVVVYLVSYDASTMRAAAHHHPDAGVRRELAQLDGHDLRADEGFTACVIDTSEGTLVPAVTPLEVDALQPDLASTWQATGCRGFVLVPVTAGDRVAALVAQCRTRAAPALTADDQEFLETVAAQLSALVQDVALKQGHERVRPGS
jgi:GAF domain-containing protein